MTIFALLAAFTAGLVIGALLGARYTDSASRYGDHSGNTYHMIDHVTEQRQTRLTRLTDTERTDELDLPLLEGWDSGPGLFLPDGARGVDGG